MPFIESFVYPILDLNFLIGNKLNMYSVLDSWLQLDIQYFQLRAKNLEQTEYVKLAKSLKNNYPNFKIIANDFYLAAIEYPEIFSGIHLGQEDIKNPLLLKSVKAINERVLMGAGETEFVAGISTHNLNQISELIPQTFTNTPPINWSYVAIGPIAKTFSKTNSSDPIVTSKQREEIWDYLKNIIMNEKKCYFPGIVLIGGIEPRILMEINFSDFKLKYGFRPIVSVVKGGVDIENLSEMINILKCSC